MDADSGDSESFWVAFHDCLYVVPQGGYVLKCTRKIKVLPTASVLDMLAARTEQIPKDRIQLSVDLLPRNYYNIQADLPEPLPPPLDPKTLQPVNPALLERLFARELVRQEVSSERMIKIPEEVLDAYRMIGRPTPLVRARRLERFLKTPAQIYFKAEYLSPTGSPQAQHGISASLLQQTRGDPEDCYGERGRTVGLRPRHEQRNLRSQMPSLHGSS